MRSGEGGVATYKVGGSEAETEGLRLALDADMTCWWSLVAFFKGCFVFAGAIEASKTMCRASGAVLRYISRCL